MGIESEPFNHSTYERLTPECQEFLASIDVNILRVVSFPINRGADRNQIFSGTDMPKLLEIVDNDWGNYKTVLGEKFGILENTFDGNLQTEVGSFMEAFIASRTIMNNQQDFLNLAEEGSIFITFGERKQSQKMPLRCSFDMLVYVGDRIVRSYEMKHTASDWTEVEDRIMSQVQSQLVCLEDYMDEPLSKVMALTGGNRKFQEWVVQPDPEWRERIKTVLERGAKDLAAGAEAYDTIPFSPVKPKAAKKNVIAELPEDAIKLANRYRVVVDTIDDLTTEKAEINSTLSKFFQAEESFKFKDAGLSASKGTRNDSPSLNKDGYIDQLEKLYDNLAKQQPNSEELIERRQKVRDLLTKDGSTSPSFLLKRG